MTQEFDPNWPHGHVTRIGGFPVRIYAFGDDTKEGRLHCGVKINGYWELTSRWCTGRVFSNDTDPGDIINAPAPVVRKMMWGGIFPSFKTGPTWSHRSDIDWHADQHLRFTFENRRCVEVTIFDKDQKDE